MVLMSTAMKWTLGNRAAIATTRLSAWLCLLLINSFTSGCKPSADGIDFTLDDFTVVALDSSYVDHFLPDLFLGRPSLIKAIGTEQLIILNRLQDTWLTNVNLQSKRQTNFLRRGKGPGETLSVRDLFVINDTLFVSGTTGNKIFHYLMATDSAVQIKETIIPGSYIRIAPNPDGGYLCLPISDGRLVRISDNYSAMDTLGRFPDIVKDNRDKVSNTIFQSMLGFSPDGRKIVSVFQSVNCFQIFDKSMKDISRKGPFKDDVSILVRETPMGTMASHTPHQNIYYSIASTHEGFVVGYIGQLIENKDDPRWGIGELLSFDWEGNPAHRIILPQQLVSFDIDWTSNTLYGITKDNSPSVVRISLPELF